MSILEKCKGNILVGDAIQDFSTLKKKYIGIVFAAMWCPYCKNGVPEIVKWFNENKVNLDIVYASNDSSSDMLDTFRKTMPWASFPFKDPRIKAIAVSLNITVIPSLIIFENTGKLLTDEGRGIHNIMDTLEKFKDILKA
jgi:thiol-disulfide isomerase/thioredoxin